MQDQTPDRTGSVVAGCFALAAFAVAIVAGLVAEIETTSILRRAFIAMLACYPIGLAAGCLCRWVVDQHASPAVSAKAAHDRLAPAGEESIDIA